MMPVEVGEKDYLNYIRDSKIILANAALTKLKFIPYFNCTIFTKYDPSTTQE